MRIHEFSKKCRGAAYDYIKNMSHMFLDISLNNEEIPFLFALHFSFFIYIFGRRRR